MKKLLSIILAVMMVLSVAISVGASGTLSANDINNLYSGKYGSYPWYSWNLGSGTIYTRWYGSCPTCDGVAYFYVSNGNINWECLDSACGDKGIIYSFGSEDGDDNYFSGLVAKCSGCQSTKNVKYVSREYNKDKGTYVYTFYCSKCGEYFTADGSSVEYPSYPWSPDYPAYDTSSVLCSYDSCNKQACFQYYFYDCGALYASYKCAAGHVTTKRVYNYDYKNNFLFDVNVITSRGGSFYINGSSKAAYGDTRKITFRAESGYALTEIYVNGEKVKVENEITVTVKGNVTVRAYFTKISDLKNYTVKASSTGGGSITAVMNGKSVDPSKISAKYTDSITFKFIPNSDNYVISSVKINGKSVDKVTTYTLTQLTSDTTIEVEFVWNCPYDDVTSTSKYLDAIEYVTEAGILKGSATATLKPQYNFYGNRAITVKTAACALAEMADVNDTLSNNTDRETWAIDKGLLGKEEDTSVVCDVQRLCTMVKDYLEYLENKNDISFTDVKSNANAKEVAIAINMVTEKTYNANRNLSKYDLAAVLYLISGLDYVDVE